MQHIFNVGRDTNTLVHKMDISQNIDPKCDAPQQSKSLGSMLVYFFIFKHLEIYYNF